MSRPDPNKGWTICSYPGDSQCVLIVLMIVGTVDHYPMRRITSMRSRGMIEDHLSGLTVINANMSGLSINLQAC